MGNSDTDKIRILFLADTSGSMYGQKTEAVKAALTEGLGVLSGYSKRKSLIVEYAAFDEKAGDINPLENITDIRLDITPGNDGFYKLTHFSCIYRVLMEKLTRQADLFYDYILLITDGKPVDSCEYMDVLERLKAQNPYRRSERYVLVVGEEGRASDTDLLQFVDYKADRIKNVGELASLISKMDFMIKDVNGTTGEDMDKYASIFG